MEIQNNNSINIHSPGIEINSLMTPSSATVASMRPDQIIGLLEAAAWIPLAGAHPWRFIYASRCSSQWDTFSKGLVGSLDQLECGAAALIIVVAHKSCGRSHGNSRAYEFHSGAVWQNIQNAASRLSLSARRMADCNLCNAFITSNIPSDHEMVSIILVEASFRMNAQISEISSDCEPFELVESRALQPNSRLQ